MVATQSGREWQLRAACRGPQATVFFPPSYVERKDERTHREREAKGICNSCTVRVECLDYALRIREPHGIWGGLNESERKQLLDRRASASFEARSHHLRHTR
ncbi:MAG TPA: WhiB family transcriptional regulator [Acidimicrobiales bacterium]|nr:WhiB family transcriptional regulator [Acidimicrobiales bacterium]